MNQSSGPGRVVNRSTLAASHPSTAAATVAAGLVIVSGRSVVDSSRSIVDGSPPTTNNHNNRTHHQHVAAMISTQLRPGADVIGSRRRRWSGSVDSRWFVRPIHLHSGPSNDESTSSDAAILFAADQRGSSSSSSYRVENGVLTSSRSTSSNPPTAAVVESSSVDRNSVDGLLKTYFPATVTASRLREAVTAVESESSPSPRQLFQHQSSLPDPTTLPYESETDSPSKRVPADSAVRTGRKLRHASSVGGTTGRDRDSRPSSTKSSSSSASNGSYDRMYLNDSQSGLPLTALMSSPYKTELARLRLDRLRLEEEQLLELKRQTELERIRGPEPKWYEMRSSGFHREVRRNNELLRNRDSWQAMLDYRVELEQAGQNLTSTLTRSSGSSVAAIGNVE